MTDTRWKDAAVEQPAHENHVLAITLTKSGRRNYVLAYYCHNLGRWASGMNSNVILWRELGPVDEIKAGDSI